MHCPLFPTVPQIWGIMNNNKKTYALIKLIKVGTKVYIQVIISCIFFCKMQKKQKIKKWPTMPQHFY